MCNKLVYIRVITNCEDILIVKGPHIPLFLFSMTRLFHTLVAFYLFYVNLHINVYFIISNVSNMHKSCMLQNFLYQVQPKTQKKFNFRFL